MTKYVYNIIFRVAHPTIDPSEITAMLAMEPRRSWKVGERRTAPNGRALKGSYDASFWSYQQDYAGSSRSFFKEVEGLIARLNSHAAFLHDLSKAGGKCEIYVQLAGSRNIGDSLPPSMLKSLADLGIVLSLEVFPNWEDA
jgi:hypothetical protein